MVGAAYCFLGFLFTFVGTRRSLGRGLAMVFLSGYLYGLLRGRYLDGLTHFGFDASLLGLYLGFFPKTFSYEVETRSAAARLWTVALIAWPAFVMLYSPALADAQPLFIQLLGLRPMVVFMPMLIVGARVSREDLDYLAPRVALLNVAALGVGLIEFVFGVDKVIPHNISTEIVYMSNDIHADGVLYSRIPSTFIHAHVYGFMMLTSIPFIAQGLEAERRTRLIAIAGLGAGIIGIFMCGARMPVVFVGLSVVYVLASLRVRTSTWLAFLAIGALGAGASMTSERLQRFQTLTDTDMVQFRITSSVSVDFVDLVAQYPLGCGLARGWGTAIPYFMQVEALPQIGGESEFSRIIIDTGLPGLILWLVFFGWAIFSNDHSQATPIMKRFAWPLTTLVFLGASLGVGLFTAVPVSPLLMLLVGIRTTPLPQKVEKRALRLIGRGSPELGAGPAPRPATQPAVARRSLVS